jgi:branched-chain amino acid transport system ATP-binding protein
LDGTLVRLREEAGLSILLVEHVISLVMNICDRVSVLDQGRFIAEGPPAAIASDVRVKRAYLGDADVES